MKRHTHSLSILKAARHNFPLTPHSTCPSAARRGAFCDDTLPTLVVQWLRTNGCLWGFDTCRVAVEGANVEVLRWVRENGCPWEPITMIRAGEKLGYKDDFDSEGLRDTPRTNYTLKSTRHVSADVEIPVHVTAF